MKTLEISCKDAGANCDFVCRGASEKELFDAARKHGKEAHGMTDIPPDLIDKMRQHIRVVEASQKAP